jgi:glutamine synthetase
MEAKVQSTKLFNYKGLDQLGNCIVEYVWIGGTGLDLRSKSKTYDFEVKSVDDLSEWNYDGSSTYQATTEKSEVTLKPVALFNDPFRGSPNKIVLCETYIDGHPTISNFRYFAKQILSTENVEKHEPWFGFEQEYAVSVKVGSHLEWPLGWPTGGFPEPQGPYYCAVGAYSFGREIMEAHYKACLYAGVKIFGTNAEVMPGQWEYQIGTCKGIEAADHMWMARYLIHRVSEYFNVSVSFEPKPILGNWNGSGCHTNYSTNETRSDSEMQNIKSQVEKLGKMHLRTISLYGENNHLRLTGKNIK